MFFFGGGRYPMWKLPILGKRKWLSQITHGKCKRKLVKNAATAAQLRHLRWPIFLYEDDEWMFPIRADECWHLRLENGCWGKRKEISMDTVIEFGLRIFLRYQSFKRWKLWGIVILRSQKPNNSMDNTKRSGMGGFFQYECINAIKQKRKEDWSPAWSKMFQGKQRSESTP